MILYELNQWLASPQGNVDFSALNSFAFFALYVSAKTLNGESLSCGSLTGSNDLSRHENRYRENLTNVIVASKEINQWD